MLEHKGRTQTTEINTSPQPVPTCGGLMPLEGLPQDNAPITKQNYEN